MIRPLHRQFILAALALACSPSAAVAVYPSRRRPVLSHDPLTVGVDAAESSAATCTAGLPVVETARSWGLSSRNEATTKARDPSRKRSAHRRQNAKRRAKRGW